MNDTNFIKKFFFLFMEELNKKKITIVSGKTASLKTFFENDIKLDSGTVDIGVRVECPRAITDTITDKLYEFKRRKNRLSKECA